MTKLQNFLPIVRIILVLLMLTTPGLMLADTPNYCIAMPPHTISDPCYNTPPSSWENAQIVKPKIQPGVKIPRSVTFADYTCTSTSSIVFSLQPRAGDSTCDHAENSAYKITDNLLTLYTADARRQGNFANIYHCRICDSVNPDTGKGTGCKDGTWKISDRQGYPGQANVECIAAAASTSIFPSS